MVLGTAMQTYGNDLAEQQEVLTRCADVIMDVYASESVLLRAEADGGPLHLAVAQVFVNDAAGRVEIAARDALNLRTRVVGVVSSGADAYAQSFRAGRAIETATAVTMADGMAVRVPVPAALEIIGRGAHDVVVVTDSDVEDAMRAFFDDTRQVVEGAGAAGFAALMQARDRRGRRNAVIASGGNVDRDVYTRVLAGLDEKGPDSFVA
jgi:threonine dehydratase